MQQKILKLFMKKGFLLDSEMLKFLTELEDEDFAKEIVNKIAIVSRQKIITKNLIIKNVNKLKPIIFELNDEKKQIVKNFFINFSVSLEIKKETNFNFKNKNEEENSKNSKENSKNYSLKVISSPIIASKKISVKDFVYHFRNRYNFFKKILQNKSELENLTSIDKITNYNPSFSVIGIVSSKTISKNKNLFLEIEDLTGTIKVLINKSNEKIFEKSKEILLDDVIGFRCPGTRDFLFIKDFFYPDSVLNENHRTDEESYALFISDLHLGSKNFLSENFEKFIKWLNGENCNEEQKNLLKKIRYLFVVGDSIDGVGIYPNQEKDLQIKDIRKQYEELAKFYKRIPDHIQIIQCPGQHDSVRIAEPQPPIGIDFAEPLYRIKNLTLVSNPSLIELIEKNNKPGIKVLMYHGASMHNIINQIEELRLSNAHSTPSKVVKHLLLRRHLSPIHGASIYIPNKDEDPMIIKEIPDIITMGDLHKTDLDKYNGIQIINCSCWQSLTAFEEKVGNRPDPCKVPIFNLKTGGIKILDFS